MSRIKKLISRLSPKTQNELKRIHFARQIRKDTFLPDEPEYEILDDLICPGDWVIDVGANVGHYTKRFSDIVAENGRVLAFEPIPATFSLLASNAAMFSNSNVTLINAAVSASFGVVGMSMPTFPTGLTNYYEAHVTLAENSSLTVLSISVDSLELTQKISLVKIDAEGHEAYVLAGMKNLINNHRPTLIIENPSKSIIDNLKSIGYDLEVLPNSPNTIFKHHDKR